MNAETFWLLMADICRLGEFIVATGVSGASANIVGEFRVSHDGVENIIEKKECGDHVHLYGDQIKTFKFGYRDAGYGAEPCLELINLGGQVCLRLYFRGTGAKENYNQFIEKHNQHRELFSGEW